MESPLNPTDDELDLLLGRGKLSGAQKDRVLEAALVASKAPAMRWHTRPMLGWALAGGLAALLVIPAAWVLSQREDDFRAKGGGARTDIQAGCVGACRVGEKLLFRVSGLAEPAYVAAFARGAAGETIWYFPDAASVAPRVEPSRGTPGPVVVPQAVELGPEHTPGMYLVYVALTPQARSLAAWMNDLATKTPAEVGFQAVTLEVAR